MRRWSAKSGDLLFNLFQFGAGRFDGLVAVVPAQSEKSNDQSRYRSDEEGFLLFQFLAFTHTERNKVHFHRALGQIAQSQTHEFTHAVTYFLEFFQVDFGSDLHVLQRVKVFYLNTKFFCKEFRRVRQRDTAAGEIDLAGSTARVLFLIELDRLVDLDVKACQDVTGNLGDLRLFGVVRFFISTAQTDKTFVDLKLFRLSKRHLGLSGKLLGDRVGSNIQGAAEETAFFKEKDVACFGTDIQKHDAFIALAVGVTKSIGERRHRNVHHLEVASGIGCGTEEALYQVTLDGDQKNFHGSVSGSTYFLIIPHHFIQRKRNILLCFVLNDLCRLGTVHRREFNKLVKYLITRRTNISQFSSYRTFSDDLAECLFQQPFTGTILRAKQT